MDVAHNHDCHCLMWKPIVAGALVSVGLAFLLNLFSVAISLTAFTTSSDGVETIAMGGLIATALGIVASMFASGWVAGYLGTRYCTKRHLGALYGFLAWCLGLLIMMFIVDYAHRYVMYYTNFISGVRTVAQTAANQVQPNITPKSVVTSTYILFALFFLSAFAASFGGHAGMRYKYREEV